MDRGLCETEWKKMAAELGKGGNGNGKKKAALKPGQDDEVDKAGLRVPSPLVRHFVRRSRLN